MMERHYIFFANPALLEGEGGGGQKKVSKIFVSLTLLVGEHLVARSHLFRLIFPQRARGRG